MATQTTLFGSRTKTRHHNPILGAIDIGSNAIRLVIGEVDHHGDVKIIKKVREPVRLGKDVFATGEISEKTRERAIASFIRFKELLKSQGVEHVRAIGTSALREARDQASFVAQVAKETGLKIEVIDGIEEGRLVFAAVSHRLDLRDQVSLLIDIGGGSVELTVADHGRPLAVQSFKLGTVRMLQMLEEKGLKEKQFGPFIDSQMNDVKAFLAPFKKKGLALHQAIGTGGNFECLGKLRVALLQKNSIFSMTITELKTVVDHLQSMSIKERIHYLRLRPDRADVVVPAALVTLAIMQTAEINVLNIPYVGLREGILSDLGSRRT